MWACWYDGLIRKEKMEAPLYRDFDGPVNWMVESQQFRAGIRKSVHYLWF